MSTGSLLNDRDLEPWLGILQEDERQAAARQLHFEDRRDRVCARAVLKMTLARVHTVAAQDWRIGREAGGRPIVLAPEAHRGLSVSVAHSRGWVACAVGAGGPVGVDVECQDRSIDLELMLPAVCDDDEHRWVQQVESAADRRGRFTALWTMKEASLKASGLGLSGGLKSPLAAGLTAQGHALDWVLWERDHVWLTVMQDQTGRPPRLWSPQSMDGELEPWRVCLSGCGSRGWPGRPE